MWPLLFCVFRISVPSPADMAATAVNHRTPLNRSPHRPPSRLTWTTDTPNPTTTTATGTGMEQGMLSTTTQPGFMLTMAAMETDPCRTRWAASASVLHTGEVKQHKKTTWDQKSQVNTHGYTMCLRADFSEDVTDDNNTVMSLHTPAQMAVRSREDLLLSFLSCGQ